MHRPQPGVRQARPPRRLASAMSSRAAASFTMGERPAQRAGSPREALSAEPVGERAGSDAGEGLD